MGLINLTPIQTTDDLTAAFMNARLGELDAAIRRNTITTVAPTTGDDANDLYSVGSYWVDTVTGYIYRCTDATVGAAVWRQIYPAVVPFVGAVVYNSAAISVSNGADQALTFNSEEVDSDDLHDTVSNTSRLTAPVDGYYRIEGTVAWASNNTNTRSLSLRVNGATTIAKVTQESENETEMQVSRTIYLSADDYVELMAYQNSGGALNVTASGSYSPYFSMVRLDR